MKNFREKSGRLFAFSIEAIGAWKIDLSIFCLLTPTKPGKRLKVKWWFCYSSATYCGCQISYNVICIFISLHFFWGQAFCYRFFFHVASKIELCEWKLIFARRFSSGATHKTASAGDLSEVGVLDAYLEKAKIWGTKVWGQFVLQLLGTVHNSSLHRLAAAAASKPKKLTLFYGFSSGNLAGKFKYLQVKVVLRFAPRPFLVVILFV